MPLARYFKGKGEQVAADMAERYGPEKGKQVFYATANKKDMNPPEKSKRRTVGQRLAGK